MLQGRDENDAVLLFLLIIVSSVPGPWKMLHRKKGGRKQKQNNWRERCDMISEKMFLPRITKLEIWEGHRSPVPLSLARSLRAPLLNSFPISPWTLPLIATFKIPFCNSHLWIWTTELPSPFLLPFCSICTSSLLPSVSLPNGHNNTMQPLPKGHTIL